VTVQPLRLDDLLQKSGFQETTPVSRADLAAFATAVGAEEREDAARQLELSRDQLRLMAGELSEQEMLTVQAVLKGLAWRIRHDPYRRRSIVIEGTSSEGDTVSTTDAMAILLAQLNRIIDGSDHPEAKTFDAKVWLAGWITTPQPALGSSAPVDLIQTKSGLREVQRVLASSETGVYL